MEKVTLEYDRASGIMYDASGSQVGTWLGLTSLEAPKTSVSPRKLAHLKEAGFDADEIVELRKAGLL